MQASGPGVKPILVNAIHFEIGTLAIFSRILH
jgi:hypothetical protein